MNGKYNNLFLVEFGEELHVVVLEEDLGLAEGPAVHLEPQQKEATVLPRGHHSLVEVEGEEAVPALKKKKKKINRSNEIQRF